VAYAYIEIMDIAGRNRLNYYDGMKTRATSNYLPLILQATSAEIRQELLRWFEREGRTFPWRSVERATMRKEGERIHDPYLILVSEVMLQQTQTARVAEKLPEFLKLFPDLESLAEAGRGELLLAWRGMGYNRRALRLQDTARAILEKHGGEFPSSLNDLEALPGVGRYTASAIACFAFGQDVAVVDVNIIRLYSRLFFKCHTPAQLLPEQTIARVAEAVTPRGDSYRWHQALMDLGATICTARSPDCAICPLKVECLSAFPPDLELFSAATVFKPEPMLRGEPRRLWRGRIVEILRNEPGGIRMGEVLERLVPPELFDEGGEADRRGLLALAETLLEEGMIERRGAVREGGLQKEDTISLPQ
jgi:A/G-specific adenine glycosylase